MVPLTSNVARVFPFQVLLPHRETGLSRDSKAQAEQVRTIDVGRVGERIARVAGPRMRQIDDALRMHLDL